METKLSTGYNPPMADTPDNQGFSEEPAFESPEDPYACSPDHDASIRRKVARTLERKKRGEVIYTSLDRAMKKFMPDTC